MPAPASFAVQGAHFTANSNSKHSSQLAAQGEPTQCLSCRFPSTTAFTLTDLNPGLASISGALDGVADCSAGSLTRKDYSTCSNAVSLFSGLAVYNSTADGLLFLGTTDRGPNQVSAGGTFLGTPGSHATGAA